MFMNAIARGLIAIGFAALLLVAPAVAREAPDAPAIWKIDGSKGDIYLFGSVHLLPQSINWRTPALDAALNEAKVVVFEIDLEEAKNLTVMQQLIAKLGVLPAGQTLRKLLSPEGRTKLERVLALLAIPAAALDPLRPWLASITVNVQWIVSKGYDPNSGVDDKVWNLAKQGGKQLAHLETIEEQLDVFAGLTRNQEIELLLVSVDQIEKSPQMLDDLVAAWRKGDTAKLDKVLNADMDELPALRDRLLKGRHAKWLPQIESMIADGRTHLIVVGTAHLVGKDSVIAMLRAKGIKVEGP
jgi:uncharacterized protein YbaP (TraB family)